mgnify:CR=1 FL=1|jgi:hypothetical protein
MSQPVEMPLITGGIVILDQDQYLGLKHKHDWREVVQTRVLIMRGSRKKRDQQYLHRLLFPHNRKRYTLQHLNGNPYDYRSENIRLVPLRLCDQLTHTHSTKDRFFLMAPQCKVLYASKGRCPPMDHCKNYLRCLYEAARLNWPGFTSEPLSQEGATTWSDTNS